MRKTAKNGLPLFSSAKPHYKVLFCKLCPVYRYMVSFSSSSNCALYYICQINIFYLIYKFEVNSLVHSSKVLSSWKEYTCGEPVGDFCNAYTERDCDRISGDRARSLNQRSVYAKLSLIRCLHSSFSLTNVWERQITAAVIFKCNNCERISKVKRFIR